MKFAMALAILAGIYLAVPAAQADETGAGVGVGPVGAGVTAGEVPDRDRTSVIKREDDTGERTTVIRKEEHLEPERKVIIREHDHD